MLDCFSSRVLSFSLGFVGKVLSSNNKNYGFFLLEKAIIARAVCMV
jgi:hypothetical protein